MPADRRDALRAWRSIVPLVHGLVDGCSESELDRRVDDSSMSIRELVHHVVEANVVAGSIVIAALGSPGAVYDWSWMMPFGEWMKRMRYDRKPLEPSLRLLEALNEYIAAQVEPLSDGLDRKVLLKDQRDAAPHAATVAEILLQEADHAREHIEAETGRTDASS